MSLPRQLIQSFEDIKSSQLIAGNITKENVQSFVDLINKAIPSPVNSISYTLYRFNRGKYLLDKSRFVNDIKDFSPYDAMILWTDFSDILEFFKLNGKIFLGWDRGTNRYRGFVLSELPNRVKILRRGETLDSIKTKEKDEKDEKDEEMPLLIHDKHFTEKGCDPMSFQESIDNDMDKIYLHMQSRLMAVTKQLNALEESK